MPLVDYESDSDDDSKSAGSQPTSPLKRKAIDDQDPGLPALPDTFHDLYATAARNGVQDDPSLHGGRKRAIPHIEGIWPSHVYVEWRPDEKSVQLIGSTLNRLDSTGTLVQSLLASDLGTDAPLHVSLSRTLSLETDQRDRFFEQLISRVREENIKSFRTKPYNLKWFPNYAGSRWFLTLQLIRPKDDNFRALLKICNEVAQVFGQPPLYAHGRGTEQSEPKRVKLESTSFVETAEDPFHISIAWSSRKPENDMLAQTTEVWTTDLGRMELDIDRIKVKLGNAIRALKLVD